MASEGNVREHDTAIFTLLYVILLTLWFHEIFTLIFTLYAEHWRKMGNFPILLAQSFSGALVNSCLLEYATVFPIKNKF